MTEKFTAPFNNEKEKVKEPRVLKVEMFKKILVCASILIQRN